MDMGTFRGVITILTMIAFFGICWWAYRGANRGRFEDDAMLPFADTHAEERELRSGDRKS